MGMVRKLSELRSSIHTKSCELSRVELDLMAAQSSLLLTHTQIERLRLQLSVYGRKTKRAASFHGEDLLEKMAKKDLHFLLPFKLQGSRLDNLRRQNRKQNHGSPSLDSERALEHEFLKLFGYAQCLAQSCDRPKECEQINPHFDAINRDIQTPSIRQRQRPHGLGNGRDKDNHRRPISLVELEERRQKIMEEQRRSILVKAPDKKQDNGVVQSLQDVVQSLQNSTRNQSNAHLNETRFKVPDSPIIGYSGENRRARLEKQRSIDVEVLRHSELRRQLSTEKPPCEPRQSLDRKYERRIERVPSDRLESHNRTEIRQEPQHKETIEQNEEKRKDDAAKGCRLQRSAPVSRMRPPHTTFRTKPADIGNVNGGQGGQHGGFAEISHHRDSGYRAVNRTKIRPPEATIHSSSNRHPSPPIPPFSPTSHTHPNQNPTSLPSPSQTISRLPKPEKRSWIERLKHIKK
ncbi:unnamed protein product, partial [Mesorhabditis belari]|uniref:Uncharacterized protein n=1 Tax=Mesorhabditis belari TaxID=2138241 RepID=A0AAF3FQ31_9BILA